MENITFELNGIKYVMIEVFIIENNGSKIERRCNRHECIVQGIVEINNGGWNSRPYAIVKILVPEQNLMAWENDNGDELTIEIQQKTRESQHRVEIMFRIVGFIFLTVYAAGFIFLSVHLYCLTH